MLILNRRRLVVRTLSGALAALATARRAIVSTAGRRPTPLRSARGRSGAAVCTGGTQRPRHDASDARRHTTADPRDVGLGRRRFRNSARRRGAHGTADIAALLLDRGAPLDLFAAAMLGELDHRSRRARGAARAGPRSRTARNSADRPCESGRSRQPCQYWTTSAPCWRNSKTGSSDATRRSDAVREGSRSDDGVLSRHPAAPARRGHALDNWVEFEGDGARFSLHAIPPAIAASIHIDSPPRPREQGGIKLTFIVRDVHSTLERIDRDGTAASPAPVGRHRRGRSRRQRLRPARDALLEVSGRDVRDEVRADCGPVSSGRAARRQAAMCPRR